MNKSWLLVFLIVACAHSNSARLPASTGASFLSPNEKIEVVFNTQPELSYRLLFDGSPVLNDSRLGLELMGLPNFKNLEIIKIVRRESDAGYTLPVGKARKIRDRHEVFYVSLREREGEQRRLDIEFRLFDDGAGFRYLIPRQDKIKNFIIADEKTEFAFHDDPETFALELPVPSSFEGYYTKQKLSAYPSGNTMNLPVLAKTTGAWVALSEAALSDYAGLNVARRTGTILGAVLTPDREDPLVKVRATAPFASPWRVILVSAKPANLLESNTISNLNESSAIRDTSWIKPGKIIFPWWSGYRLKSNPRDKNPAHQPGLNTWSLKKYIDFAAANKIEFFSFDGYDQAWYGGDIGNPLPGVDLTKSIPQIDMPEVLGYARAKKVRPRIWMHADPLLRSDMDHVFAVYEKWGVEGVMVDFINNDDQESVRAYTKMVQTAARHRLTINFHGVWKPTGFTRTYPNLLSHEAVMSSEYNRFTSADLHGSPPEHETTYAWVRSIAGPADIHPGSFNPVLPENFHPPEDSLRAMGTLARQLALYVVIESGLPMVADAPEEYLKRPRDFEFVKKVPAAWDETRVVAGEPGESIAVARRNGKDWYIGAITDRIARKLKVPLNFLGLGKFRARIWSDLPGRPGQTLIRNRTVTAADSLDVEMEPSGGQAILFTR